MDKTTLLQSVTKLSRENVLTSAELMAAYETGQGKQVISMSKRHISVPEVLGYIGAAIVGIGAAILIGQNWEVLSTVQQLLATLGIGILAYILGVMLFHKETLGNLSMAFFFLAAIVLPIGLFVAFDKSGFQVYQSSTQAMIAAIMVAVYLASDFIMKSRPLFTFFSVVFGTWLFYAFSSYLLQGNPLLQDIHFQEYRALAVGLCYILLGYAFKNTIRRSLTGVLYSFGLIAVLSAAMALGGWSPNSNLAWEVAYPGLVFAVIFLSIYLKSKPFLVFGSMYLMGYIVKLTAEYFADSLGWPVALMVGGLVLIGVGFLTFFLHKRYMGKVAHASTTGIVIPQ